jgi:hypothetical protein
MTMPRMTEEEADALDELVTKNPPRVSGDGKSGFFMKHKGNIEIVTSDEEKKLIQEGRKHYREHPEDFMPLESIQ